MRRRTAPDLKEVVISNSHNFFSPGLRGSERNSDTERGVALPVDDDSAFLDDAVCPDDYRTSYREYRRLGMHYCT
jgi:hypothetical protein